MESADAIRSPGKLAKDNLGSQFLVKEMVILGQLSLVKMPKQQEYPGPLCMEWIILYLFLLHPEALKLKLCLYHISPHVTLNTPSRSNRKFDCMRLKTKFNTYAPFHISVIEDVPLIQSTKVWVVRCLTATCYGHLTNHIFNSDSQVIFRPLALGMDSSLVVSASGPVALTGEVHSGGTVPPN